MRALGRTKVSEGKFPLSVELGKDDSGVQRISTGMKSPKELGTDMGLGQDSQWRERPGVGSKYTERGALPETKSLGNELELRLKRQTLTERGSLGLSGVSALQETEPLGMSPGRRVALENECCVGQPPSGVVCGSPQAVDSRKASVAGGPEGTEQSVLGLQGRPGLEEESTCVVMKSSTEVKPPVEVDTGLPQTESDVTEPQVGLVIEPSPCQLAQPPEEAGTPLPPVERPDCIRPIYSGKFVDRMPCWPTAGKVSPVGYRVATCLTEKLPRLITPPEAKKYFNFRYPPPGAERIFYGKANDPRIAPYLTHGIRSKISIPVNALINPQPITTFQQKIRDKKESIYYSNRWAPLGKSHDQTPGLPKGMDIINTTFGTAVIREVSARDVVNPPKSYEEVFKEGGEGHDLYVISHNDYYAGEAKNRKYNPKSFHRFDLFGVPTPHCNDGKNMAKSLHWLHELQMKRGAKIVSKRVDDFKEKFQHKLGRVLDPLAETMTVPQGHTFGACLSPEEYGADDLIYNRHPGEYLRGRLDRSWPKFKPILNSKGDGMIDKAELQEACDQANVHLDETLLTQLFDYCDVDGDGLINYLEFANFLTWKDNIPLTDYEQKVIIKGRKPDCANPAEANVKESEPTLLIKPEDIVLKEPGAQRRCSDAQRPNDKVSHFYKTSSSEISSVVGAVPAICYPIHGVPTVRADIPAPRIRRVSDRTNYGEEGNAYSLLHPTIFAQKGVFERDFFKNRSKEEITEILCNIGIKLSEEEFENVWNLASKKHHRGEVCVENIRNVLDELQHADRIKCKNSK
nr:EF-hand domain-containing family member B [Cavia porcellus]